MPRVGRWHVPTLQKNIKINDDNQQSSARLSQLQPREPSHKHLPIDDLEPLIDDDNGYREAAKIGLRLINNIMHLIHTSRHNPVTFWAIAYALGLDITEGRSMTAQASRLGVTRAALSKSQQAMRRKLGLPTNTNNKPESAVKTYKTNRDNQL